MRLPHEWITEYLNLAAGVGTGPRRLPTVLGPTAAAGTVRAHAADALDCRRALLVGPGGGDQHAGYLGLGLIDGDQYFGIRNLRRGGGPRRAFRCSDPSGWSTVADLTGGYLPLGQHTQRSAGQ